MNKKVTAYGLTSEQQALLEAVLPERCEVAIAECITDLITTTAFCSIVDFVNLDDNAKNTLLAYYMDVGDQLSETVVWLGNVEFPNLSSFVRYDSFLDFLTELDSILARSQVHYDTMQMYGSEHSYLPKHAIEESIEADIHTALHRKYGANPDLLIVKRMRRELTALREVDATAELAAVYEFAAWLKHNKHPYQLGGTAVCGMIPFLLGIHDVNPLPPHLYCPECQKVIWKDDYKDGFDILPEVCLECGGLMHGDGHDLVWQEYASYGRVPSYVFYLLCDMKPLIFDWLDSHWLRKYMGDQWEAAQPYEDHLARGNMLFRFELNRDEISPEFYSTDTVATGGILLKELPICCEEVFFYLREHDFVDKDAFRGMTSVRKGKGLPVVTEDMQAAQDHWKAEYFNQIEWMPSKATLLQRLFFEQKSKLGRNKNEAN